MVVWASESVKSLCFFFFSSRRRHTRSLRDWSSDVCSSDLLNATLRGLVHPEDRAGFVAFHEAIAAGGDSEIERSEERRVGKECRSRWSTGTDKKKGQRGDQQLLGIGYYACMRATESMNAF